MVLATVFAVLVGLVALFQLALALGTPWGRLAWGGRHPGVLPVGYRIGSAVAVVIYAAVALLALDLGGVVDVVPNGVSRVAMWVVFGLLAVGTAMNALSRSRPERYTMTPVALVLAVLALLVALAGPVPRTFEGMVLDDGDGPVFCTVVMESYPPQCGRDSPAVTGWDWGAVAHERSQGIRWGSYRFEGVQDRGTITVTGTPAAVS